MLHQGAWYVTCQGDGQIQTAPSLSGPWTFFADVLPYQSDFNVTIEDPVMFVDARQNWHLLYHAYNLVRCSSLSIRKPPPSNNICYTTLYNLVRCSSLSIRQPTPSNGICCTTLYNLAR
jgi:hypothetical protein